MERHPYGLILLGALAAATVATLVTGISGPLPGVALGSPALLRIERAVVIFTAAYVVFVVIARALKGELATRLSLKEIEFPPQALKDAKAAAQGALTSERESGDEAPVDDVLALRVKLEAKMAYVAKFLLRDEKCCGPTFLTVGSLGEDGYLTADEVRTASWVLTLRDEELDTLPAGRRAEFLRDADKVVTNLRASVFYALVRKLLEEDPSWKVKEISTKRKRPDLHAVKGTQQFRIAPRFAMKKSSAILEKEKERLEEFAGPKSKRGKILLVVPDRSRSPQTPDDDPAVIKLKEFKSLLGLTKDPRTIEDPRSSDD